MTKRILKYIATFLLLLLGLFLFIVLLLQFPSVQSRVTQQLTRSLSKSLNSQVIIKRVDIDFFKTVVLEGIYIEDQHQDTLLYAERLAADIGLFSIFKQEIHLNTIELKKAKINLVRMTADSAFNFEFLVNAFKKPPDTVAVDTSTAGWIFRLGGVTIENSEVDFLDEQAGIQLKAPFSYFSATANTLDFHQQIIDLQRVRLGGAMAEFQLLQKDTSLVIKQRNVEAKPLTFPDLGWDLSIKNFEIVGSNFIYNDKNSRRNSKGIDFQHLEVCDIILIFNDFAWKDKNIVSIIDRIGFSEKSGFDLTNIQGKFIADSSQIILENLIISTPYSRLINTTTLQLKEFSDLSDFANKVVIKSEFDNVNISFHDLKLFAPEINNLQQLNTDLKENLYLNGKINGKLNKLSFRDLDLKIGNQINVSLDGHLRDITNLEEALFDIDLKNLSTSYEKIQQLTKNIAIPKELAEFGQFTLSGKAIGQIHDFQLKDLLLQTASNTYLKGDAYLVGLPNINDLRFDVVINTLETKVADWKSFFTNGIPPILDSLSTIQFNGKIDGDIKQFELVGDLNTGIGKLESNVLLHFTEDYGSGTYKGDLRLVDFELNRAFPNSTQLGTASLSAKGQGSGFVLDSLIADAQVVIDSITYNDYTYRDIIIDGKFEQKDFDGHIKLADENIRLDFNGLINLKDSIPDFSFVLDLDTLNLLPLNFTKKELFIQLDAAIDFKGDNLDNINGESIITDFLISNETDTYKEDSIFFSAKRPAPDSAYLSLKSDFLKATINGDFDAATLSNVLLNYIKDYFPINNLLDTLTKEKVAVVSTKQQNFKFDINIKDPTPLTLLFVPELTQLEDASIKGSFNRKAQILEMEAIVDALHFGALQTDQLIFTANGTTNNLTANLALLNTEAAGLRAPLAIFDVDLKEDSLHFQLQVTGDTLENRLAFKGIAYDTPQWYEFKLTDDFFLNGETWKIAANNGIYFLDNYLFVNNLKLREGSHQLAIQSEGFPKKTSATPPLTLTFDDFQINDITNFLVINQNRFKGLINGNFTLNDPFGNAHYLANLTVDSLTLNESPIGQFYLDSEQSQDGQNIKVIAGLKGDKNNLELTGNYLINEKAFDAKGEIQAVELRLLNPFTEQIVSDTKGLGSGQFTLVGTPKAPIFNGTINLQEASTIIYFLGTRIFIPAHTIEVNNNTIKLGSVAVKDVDGQTGTVSGNIKHQLFTGFDLDLRFQSDAFQIMNTTAAQNPLFFGQLFVAATVDIKGPLKLPNIDVTAKTLANSVFNLQPLIESDQLTTDDYIIVTSREKYLQAGDTATIKKYKLANKFNLDLLMNLDITPDVLVRVIIDPLTGDQVEGRGNSNMTMTLSPAGDMKILGDFLIESGSYNFSYQNLVKKKFAIQPNSRISFTGDPLKAQFDITAAYNLKTTTYELVKNEITDNNSGEIAAAKRRVEVETLLYLKGLFTKPAISFDIQLADGLGSDVNSSVIRKLNDLRNNQDEMNKQVFALLLFNSFIASDNTGISLAGTGQNVALSSVSKLVSNELNNLASKYLKGLEVSFDLGSYQSNFADGTNNSAVEMGIGLSQKLFNDRITISANADVNLNNQSANSGSNLAGDFVLEYQLTESGSYVLRVFRLSDFDILTDQNTAKNGVGINYRKAFGNPLKRKKKNK